MVTGNWLNSDNLFLQFGTSKAVNTGGGEYKSLGENRVIDLLIDLTTLNATAAIQSNTLFFPSGSNVFVERVELDVEVAAAGASTLKVGLIQQDRATVPANYDHAFINAETQADMATLGDRQVYVGADSTPAGSSKGGILIGTFPASATGPYYITATGTGTPFSTGKVRVRIYFHGVGTIPN